MKFYSLSSGSSGNSTLIENNGHYILIDVGLTQKELISKLKSQKVPITYNDNLLEDEYTNIYNDIDSYDGVSYTILKTFSRRARVLIVLAAIVVFALMMFINLKGEYLKYAEIGEKFVSVFEAKVKNEYNWTKWSK